MTKKLTTSELIVNLEKIISPTMIALSADLNSRQLGYVDLWALGQKDLTETQYKKLSFAWETLTKMVGINGKKPVEEWYSTPSIIVVRNGIQNTISPAYAIALKEFEAVQRTIGPLK